MKVLYHLGDPYIVSQETDVTPTEDYDENYDYSFGMSDSVKVSAFIAAVTFIVILLIGGIKYATRNV